MKSDKIATDKTFGIVNSAGLLRKLEWEMQLCKEHRYTDESVYIDLNIAWTAFHALDWIAWEISDLKLWPEVVAALGLPIDASARQGAKLKALQEFARSSCPAMEQLEQTALAAKHRNLRNCNEGVATTVHRVWRTGPTKADRASWPLSFYTRTNHPDAEGTPSSGQMTPYQIAREAHTWLVQLADRFQLKEKVRRHIIDTAVAAQKSGA